MSLRIGFDAKRAVKNLTGLGNYSRTLIGNLQHYYPYNRYFLYAPAFNKSSRTLQLVSQPNTESRKPPNGNRFLSKGLWRSYGITKQLKNDRLDVYHGLSGELPLNINTRVTRSIVTIHDLIFLRFPAYYPWIDRKIYAYKARRACEMADKVVAISLQTKQDLCELLGLNENRISIQYQSCDPSFFESYSSQEKEAVRKKYELPARFVLSVGSVEARKNVLTLLKAIHQLPDAHAVIVGKKTAYATTLDAYIRKTGIASRVHFRHEVSFADLPKVYQMADIFVYISLYEGFGIPILEALYSKVPVIASSGRCFEEVGGLDSCYIDPLNEEALANAIKRITSDPERTKIIVDNGRTFARRFDPEKTAASLFELYQHVAAQ